MTLNFIQLYLYSSHLVTGSTHFECLNVPAGEFPVMICHFEGIRSLILAGFSGFIFLFQILNVSLTAGFQNVHPR